jgi:hypothetical protein
MPHRKPPQAATARLHFWLLGDIFDDGAAVKPPRRPHYVVAASLPRTLRGALMMPP